MPSKKDIKNVEYTELLKKYNTLVAKYDTIVKVSKITMHDVRSPLRFLHVVAESLISPDKHQNPAELNKNLQLLAETSRNLYFFATNVLEWFINNKIDISLEKEKINLSEIVRDIIEVFEKQITANNNKLVTAFEEDIEIISNKEVSTIIIRNALDNANKYTQNGNINIYTKKNKNLVTFFIEDNGKGFDRKKMREDLDSNNSSISQNLGFRIIHDLAAQIGLEYIIESEEGAGTIFRITYPLA